MKQIPFGPVRFDILQLKRKDRATINSIEELQDELDNTLTSVSGNPITISDASNTNAENFTVTLVPTQAGTGDPSPTNVRAISGLSSVDVVLNDNTITFSLGSTIYSGSVNMSTGKLTVDKVLVDLGSYTWAYIEADKVFYNVMPTECDYNAGNTNTLCEGFTYDTDANWTTDLSENQYMMCKDLYSTSRVSIAIKNSTITTVEDFKTSVTGIHFLYPLATPTTTSLTATQIRLLQGENELSTTGSSMSFKYQRDNLIGELKAWVLDQLS